MVSSLPSKLWAPLTAGPWPFIPFADLLAAFDLAGRAARPAAAALTAGRLAVFDARAMPLFPPAREAFEDLDARR
jgi:hypothetical protein